MGEYKIERTKKNKILRGKRPKQLSIDLNSGELSILREASERKVQELDKKIDLYVEELLELLLPVDSTQDKHGDEKAALRRILRETVAASVYKIKLGALYRQINKEDRTVYYESDYNYFYSDTQRLLTNKEPRELQGSPLASEKYKRRYTASPNSPDLTYIRENKKVQDVFAYSWQTMSKRGVKNSIASYPYLNDVVALRDFIFNGGRLDRLPSNTSMFYNAHVQTEALRKILVEKTMILDGEMYDFAEYKNRNLFGRDEYLYILFRSMVASNNISRIINYAEVELEGKRMNADRDHALKTVRAVVRLNEGRLENLHSTKQFNGVLEDIISDAAIDLNAIGDKEAIKDFKESALGYITETAVQHRAPARQRPSKDFSEKTKTALKGIAGVAAMISVFALVGYVENYEKIEAALEEIRSSSQTTPKIVEQDQRTLLESQETVSEDSVVVIVPDENGEEKTLYFPKEIAFLIDDELKKGIKLVKNKERDDDENLDKTLDKNLNDEQIGSFESTTYIPRHAKKDGGQLLNPTTNESQVGIRRRRRMDRYASNGKDRYASNGIDEV